jgi:hypothetical protein
MKKPQLIYGAMLSGSVVGMLAAFLQTTEK